MHIALVGMSNIGKSHWAHRLATEAGYSPISCDDAIEIKLATELKAAGYVGIGDVTAWMGQPFDKQYGVTSRAYQACERTVMREALCTLKKNTETPMVVDTTGSVVYLDAAILSELKALTRVVYFEATAAHVDSLFERFSVHPKPVIWDQMYRPEPGEAPKDALKRCYPKLLIDRARRYAELADVVVPFEQHKARETSLSKVLGLR